MSEIPWTKTPQWWVCPYCGAGRGYLCQSPSGWSYNWFHTARWRRMQLAPGRRGIGIRLY